MLKALKFIQWLYIHRPAGIQPAQIRHVHIRIAHILRLPYRWDDLEPVSFCCDGSEWVKACFIQESAVFVLYHAVLTVGYGNCQIFDVGNQVVELFGI